MFINSGDDFINPPELGIAEREIKKVKNGKFVLLPSVRADARPRHPHLGGRLAAVFKRIAGRIAALSDSAERLQIFSTLMSPSPVRTSMERRRRR